MSSSITRPPNSSTNGAGGKSYFEQQREMLMGEVAISLDHVLHNINKLNRSLEEIISVGNEFQPVEALWSHFENVMAKDPEAGEGNEEEGEGEEGDTVVKPEENNKA